MHKLPKVWKHDNYVGLASYFVIAVTEKIKDLDYSCPLLLQFGVNELWRVGMGASQIPPEAACVVMRDLFEGGGVPQNLLRGLVIGGRGGLSRFSKLPRTHLKPQERY